MNIEKIIHFRFRFQNLLIWLFLYLLLALLWGSLFMLLEECVPGSFAGFGLGQASPTRNEFQYFNYLSDITITTSGYGDITP